MRRRRNWKQAIATRGGQAAGNFFMHSQEPDQEVDRVRDFKYENVSSCFDFEIAFVEIVMDH